MNVFKIKPTINNSCGCALVAANDEQEAIKTYEYSALYRKKWYKDGGCVTDIVASLDCKTKNPCVLFDCITINVKHIHLAINDCC